MNWTIENEKNKSREEFEKNIHKMIINIFYQYSKFFYNGYSCLHAKNVSNALFIIK